MAKVKEMQAVASDMRRAVLELQRECNRYAARFNSEIADMKSTVVGIQRHIWGAHPPYTKAAELL